MPADSKVSGLPAVTAFTTTQEFPVNDSGVSKKITGAQLQAGLSRTRARAYLAGAQTMAGTGFQKISLDTASYDPAAGWDLVTNRRWTCPAGQGGYYQVNAAVNAAVTAGRMLACVYKNGVNTAQGNDSATSGANSGSVVADVIPLVSGDYLELWCFQNSGASAVSSGLHVTFLSLHFLSAT